MISVAITGCSSLTRKKGAHLFEQFRQDLRELRLIDRIVAGADVDLDKVERRSVIAIFR
jgi:hypothetical protein